MKVDSILPQDDFCGTTFLTPKGGILTVVGHNGLKCNKKKYYCICSICHKDPELFPDYFESRKGNLEHGRFPCGCSKKPQLNELQYSIIVSREATKRGHEFRGFVDGKYVNQNTYVIMFCPEHGEWRSTIYVSYMKGSGCPCCGVQTKKEKQKTQNPEEQITEEATKRGHEFRGFVDGKYVNQNTYVIMFCPEHGEWRSTTYTSYMSGRGCPSCGGSQKTQNPEEQITEEATKRGHEFRGFVDGKYVNQNAYVIMFCPEHGEWRSTTYTSYMRGSGCSGCGIESQKEKQKIQNPEERITEKAVSRGHEFCGFVDGKYVNQNTYVIMFCPEHGEWQSTTYNNYMNGHGCPCCVESGYVQTKPGTFYIIQYETSNEVFLKYGITNRDTETRAKEHIKGIKDVTSAILKEYHFKDGSIPFKMEKAVDSKYGGGVTTVLTSGNTETARVEDLQDILDIIENYKNNS